MFIYVFNLLEALMIHTLHWREQKHGSKSTRCAFCSHSSTDNLLDKICYHIRQDLNDEIVVHAVNSVLSMRNQSSFYIQETTKYYPVPSLMKK